MRVRGDSRSPSACGVSSKCIPQSAKTGTALASNTSLIIVWQIETGNTTSEFRFEVECEQQRKKGRGSRPRGDHHARWAPAEVSKSLTGSHEPADAGRGAN